VRSYVRSFARTRQLNGLFPSWAVTPMAKRILAKAKDGQNEECLRIIAERDIV
jgi:hypothetical protein